MTKEGTLEVEKNSGTIAQQPVAFSSNEVRLSCRQWIIALSIVAVLLYFLPVVWMQLEKFEPAGDYRFPYKLSNDYWLYSRYCQSVHAQKKTVIIGDSVIWGQYVKKDQTLAHYLNKLASERGFANLGLDGAHPVALSGLIDHYGDHIHGMNVILHFNPLWLSSKKHDLQTRKEFRFNHPRLVPQFLPRIPCYTASISTRIGIIIERNVPLFSWTNHLRSAYFQDDNGLGRDLPAWAMANPIDNPLKAVTPELRNLTEDPGYEPRPRPNSRAARSDLPWVELKTSLQWKAFQRLIKILHDRNNTVFVLVGPLNEHILNDEGLKAYGKIKKDIEAWLRQKNISCYIPSPLPGEYYADASHPVSEGYALLAEQLLDNEALGGR